MQRTVTETMGWQIETWEQPSGEAASQDAHLVRSDSRGKLRARSRTAWPLSDDVTLVADKRFTFAPGRSVDGQLSIAQAQRPADGERLVQWWGLAR
jgi:hypothetical protein